MVTSGLNPQVTAPRLGDPSLSHAVGLQVEESELAVKPRRMSHFRLRELAEKSRAGRLQGQPRRGAGNPMEGAKTEDN
jgi:hypothetical protein